MTRAGFPHSDTPGSTLGWQLPEAYPSLPRPSSASGAKASTTCPYQLDTHEHTTPQRHHHPHAWQTSPPAQPAASTKGGHGFFAKTLAHTLNLPTPTPHPRATPPAAPPLPDWPAQPTRQPEPRCPQRTQQHAPHPPQTTTTHTPRPPPPPPPGNTPPAGPAAPTRQPPSQHDRPHQPNHTHSPHPRSPASHT